MATTATGWLERPNAGNRLTPAAGGRRNWGLWLAIAAMAGVALMPAQAGLPIAGQYALTYWRWLGHL